MTAAPLNIPSPDPSLATNERLAAATKQLQEEINGVRVEAKAWVDALQLLEEREIKNLRDLLFEKIGGTSEVLITRLIGMDKAIVILQTIMDRVPQQVQERINDVKLLLEGEIESSADKTISLDRVVQTRLAGSETALNAAMAAADKVTQKIEINFGAVMNEMKAGMTKQIDTIKETIDDLKGRLDRGEGVTRGTSDTGAEQRAMQAVAHSGNQNMIGICAAFIAAIALAVAVYVAMHPNPMPINAAQQYQVPQPQHMISPRI